jgi:hypothetical protein
VEGASVNARRKAEALTGGILGLDIAYFYGGIEIMYAVIYF